MKNVVAFVALFAVASLVSTNYAQETSAENKEACTGACPIAKAMDALPKMTYTVGEHSACCPDSAAVLAKKHKLPVTYVVGKKKFDKKDTAFVSLVEQTESYVNKFIEPCKCEVSGKTTIAGKTCDCPVEAGKTAELVKTAAKKVQMTYVVGEKTCNCPHEAASLAKTSGKAKVFVVGDQKTSCEHTARLTLAKAKYKAAVEALAAASKKAEPTKKAGT
ncbi:MAG: hypothetical protein AAFN77_22795 [Planctomycetota bacterium]